MLERAIEHSVESYQCGRMAPCPYTATTLITKLPWAGPDHDEARAAVAASLNLQSYLQSEVPPREEIEMRSFTIQGSKHIFFYHFKCSAVHTVRYNISEN